VREAFPTDYTNKENKQLKRESRKTISSKQITVNNATENGCDIELQKANLTPIIEEEAQSQMENKSA